MHIKYFLQYACNCTFKQCKLNTCTINPAINPACLSQNTFHNLCNYFLLISGFHINYSEFDLTWARPQVSQFFLKKTKITVWITSFQTYFWTPEFFLMETRLKSNKNAPNEKKNCKIQDVEQSTLLFGFQQLFCVPSWI